MADTGYLSPENERLRDYCEAIFRDILSQGGYNPDDVPGQMQTIANTRTCYEAMVGNVLIVAQDVSTADEMTKYGQRKRNLLSNLAIAPDHALRIAEEGIEDGIGRYVLTVPQSD